MQKIILFFIIPVFLFLESVPAQDQYRITDSVLFLKAKKLSDNFITIDTHIDLPLWLYNNWFDVSKLSDKGEFDYQRAMEGGLDAAFMAVYTPPSLEGTGKSKIMADSLITIVHKIVSEYPDKFSFAPNVTELVRQVKKGKVVLAIGMENGSPIENNLDNLREFYSRGVCYVTLAHYKWNHICDSANDPERKWNGLSPFGEEVIKEMNKLGMMIDVSHLSDSTFYDIMQFSKAPVIASHSCCRFFTPGNERNMSDEMLKLLAENGGVIQIGFAGMFLKEKILKQHALLQEAEDKLTKYLKDNKIDRRSDEAKKLGQKLITEYPIDKASVSDVADHIDHIVKLIGIDYVGIGSDFNGIGDDLPVGLEDVSKIPNLVYELLKRGYRDEDIIKILGGNILRVWKKVEMISTELK